MLARNWVLWLGLLLLVGSVVNSVRPIEARGGLDCGSVVAPDDAQATAEQVDTCDGAQALRGWESVGLVVVGAAVTVVGVRRRNR
ncbi:hypothetical protein [Allostreptomyces psammosilenae]|uniref:Uncharacterized protein n=1 Tax=Allostreptomyces psammosilenae TaxID=1892865 RepID=A0A852ZPH8_9ACTN|nr:hypothetical protein [Allostreptomyces psammosilenae]NYI04293.1 hypothetical protein [Allostreptomyces psammosilenae]